MNFLEAVKLAEEGKKITRKYYKLSNNFYLIMQNNILFLEEQESLTPYYSKYLDIIADDWEVVEEEAL